MPPVTPSKICLFDSRASMRKLQSGSIPYAAAKDTTAAQGIYDRQESLAMRIRDWPAAERPREKLLTQGPGALSTAELLALLIGHGREGLTAVDMARQALQHYGGIRDLLDAPMEDL